MDNQVSQYQSLPGNMLYNNLISNIEQGQIKIPQVSAEVCLEY